jgi:hypothetical protein
MDRNPTHPTLTHTRGNFKEYAEKIKEKGNEGEEELKQFIVPC